MRKRVGREDKLVEGYSTSFRRTAENCTGTDNFNNCTRKA